MNKKINVLVFPCGAENSIEIFTALKDVVNIELFGASSIDNHGKYLFKNYISNIPFINKSNFVDSLNEIISTFKIDIIFPTHDDVVLKLAENESLINCKIAIAGLEQANVCRSKKLIYEIFKNEDFCPKVFKNLKEIKEFPIFIKPDKGQGSKGSYKIENRSKLEEIDIDNYVITEHLPGEEITVDCFSDNKNKLKFIGPRTRDRILAGISVRSKNITLSKEIMLIAEKINTILKMNGLWYFQLKKDKNENYKLLEISIRASGTMNLFRNLGINFPLLTIYNILGYEIDLLINNYTIEVDRALYNRYKIDFDFKYIYIDFDDTITKNNIVNPFVMYFLYNALRNNKKIYLITKHELDIFKTLNDLAIHLNLFTKIIHIKPDEEKYNFIEEKEHSIFIDNSFVERQKIFTKLRIPVFDVDAIQSLINYKE